VALLTLSTDWRLHCGEEYANQDADERLIKTPNSADLGLGLNIMALVAGQSPSIRECFRAAFV
jgi:hypothetical protein